LIVKLFKIIKKGEVDEDNFRADANYLLKPIGRPILNRWMWYQDAKNPNILFHTEVITKVGINSLKGKKCKYIIQIQEE